VGDGGASVDSSEEIDIAPLRGAAEYYLLVRLVCLITWSSAG